MIGLIFEKLILKYITKIKNKKDNTDLTKKNFLKKIRLTQSFNRSIWKIISIF